MSTLLMKSTMSPPTLSSSLNPPSPSSHSSLTISYLARSGLIAFAILTPAILLILQTVTLSHKGVIQFSTANSITGTNSRPISAANVPAYDASLFSQALPQLRCNKSLFYNKPPKTASTFIQVVIGRWVKAPYRYINCGGKRALETNLYLRDCLPLVDDGCTIFSAHVKLNDDALQVVNSRLAHNALKLTSTRYPAHRIMSFFLQINRLKSWEDGDSINDARLKNWLQSYNPWALYNYHTGESRVGSCPLTSQERNDIFDVAIKYDLVIDANLVQQSNTILSHYNLFNLPLPSEEVKANVRGALNLNFSDNVKRLIRNVSCVEDELHRAFHVRMASLYERITGKKCIKHGDINELGSCMDDFEHDALKSTWLV